MAASSYPAPSIWPAVFVAVAPQPPPPLSLAALSFSLASLTFSLVTRFPGLESHCSRYVLATGSWLPLRSSESGSEPMDKASESEEENEELLLEDDDDDDEELECDRSRRELPLSKLPRPRPRTSAP